MNDETFVMSRGRAGRAGRAGSASWVGRVIRAGCAAGLVLLGTATRAAVTLEPSPMPESAPLAVKVLVINLFGLEAAPWIAALQPLRDMRVPGLPTDSPSVQCNPDAVCQMTTGMGHANAAASVMAVLLSGKFDLRKTYFLVAGIAGIDPHRGSIGSAAWARYVVDTGIAHEIDAREMPRGWPGGYFGVLTDSPEQVPKLEYHTEVFTLDEALLQAALTASKAVELEDAEDVRTYRQQYPYAPANLAPRVIQCDTVSGDTWWSGRRLSARASQWTRLLTHDRGVYCTTAQEDNAILAALTRGAQSGLADVHRVAVLRTGSDFDQPYPHQGVLQSMQAQRGLNGALKIATDNLVKAGKPLVDAVVQNWNAWQAGVPVAGVPAAAPR